MRPVYRYRWLPKVLAGLGFVFGFAVGRGLATVVGYAVAHVLTGAGRRDR